MQIYNCVRPTCINFFNGLPQFVAVERLFTLEGKIFAPLLTYLSSVIY